LRVANEGFPDRRYKPDGTLVSRKEADAILASPIEVGAHAVTLAKKGIDFAGRQVRVDTLCLHGDNLHAAENARVVRDALAKEGIGIKAL
jgi:UPF0271 protein